MTTSLSSSSTYIDETELIRNYYGTLDFPSNIYHKQLEQWIDDNKKENRLLLVQSPDGEGKKTFLVNWLNNMLTERKDIKASIIHFGSFSNNFSEIIYKTLSKLRELLDIGQKIELVEQTLRKYFPYWLEVCSRTLQQNCISQGIDPNQKILLIFEGVDHLVDSKGDTVTPGFWLPTIFPKNIKVITTATTGSKSAKQLLKKAGQVFDYKCPSQIKQHLFASLPVKIVTHIKALNPSLQYLNLLKCFINNNKFVKHFESSLNNLNNFQLKPFLQGVINFWAKQLTPYPVKLVLSLICFSKKGLTREEIYRAANINQTSFNEIFSIFSGIICNYKQVYIVCDSSISQKIKSILKVQQHIRLQIHRILAESISSSANCIRKLEQEIYHLEESRNYLQLKETLSQVQNFLFLFNPNTKYILSNCWHRLETKHMFDPTFQYNKAIESYQTHYYPSEKDIFRIILQLSRFFMQYAGFETFDTPIFRHPAIDGDEAQLKQTSMFDEFKSMSMFLRQRKNKTKAQKLQKDKQKNKDEKSLNKTKAPIISDPNYSEQKMNVIQLLQGLNIQIPSNKDRFREYYLKQLQNFFSENRLQDERQLSDQEEGQQQQKVKIIKLEQPKKDQSIKLIKTLKQFEEQNYQMNRVESNYYYYKQWIWVQFPWISLSLDYNYSETIRKCINPPTQYMSIKQQHALTSQALKIAIEAKKTKQSVLQKKPKGLNQTKQLLKVKTIDHRKTNTNISMVTKTAPIPQINNVSMISKAQTNVNRTFITQKQNSISLPQINESTSSIRNFLTKPSKTVSHKTPVIELKKVLDQRIFLNKQLNKKIKQLQFKMQEQQSNFTEKQIKKTKTKITLNEQKLESVNAQFAKSMKLLEKIQIIINICALNKVHNLECVTPLNTFIQKLKFMIEDEERAATKNKQDLYLSQKQYKKQIQKLSVQNNDLEKILHKQDRLMTQQSDNGVNQQTAPLLSMKKTPKKSTLNAKSQINQNPYEFQQQMISRFSELIGSFKEKHTTEKIQNFQQKFQARRLLNQRFCELQFQYQNILKQLQQKKKIDIDDVEEQKQPKKTTFIIHSSLNSLQEEYQKILKKRVMFQQVLEKLEEMERKSTIA